MNYKRALLLSLLAYVISFIVGFLAALAFSVDFSGDEPIPQSLWYVGLVASVIIMASLTLWYFKSDTTTASTLNGLAFGAIAVVFSAALDALIFIPATLSGRGNELISYYSEPLFWITLILVIVTTTLVGYLMGRKSGGDGAGKEEVRGEPEPLQKTFVPATEKPAESETVEPVSLGAPPGAPEVTPKVPTPPHTPPPPPPPTPTPPPPSPPPPQTPETPATPVEPPAQIPTPVEPPIPSPEPTPTPSPFNPPRTPTPHVANTDVGSVAGTEVGSVKDNTDNTSEKPI